MKIITPEWRFLQKERKISPLALIFWGRRRLAKEFGASERQTRKAKKLVAEKGILTSSNLKEGKTLDSEIENLVNKFYLDDENSRMMPGMKDFVSVKKDDGSREHIQKKLILCNLS